MTTTAIRAKQKKLRRLTTRTLLRTVAEPTEERTATRSAITLSHGRLIHRNEKQNIPFSDKLTTHNHTHTQTHTVSHYALLSAELKSAAALLWGFELSVRQGSPNPTEFVRKLFEPKSDIPSRRERVKIFSSKPKRGLSELGTRLAGSLDTLRVSELASHQPIMESNNQIT